MVHRPFACLLIALFTAIGCDKGARVSVSDIEESESARELDAYVGRYRMSADLVIEVKVEGERLQAVPSFWRAPIILEPTGENSFRSLLHSKTQFRFERGEDGRVTRLQVEGHRKINGLAERMAEEERLPVEYVHAGDVEGAMDALSETELESPDRAIALAFEQISRFPSRAKASVDFATWIAHRFPDDPKAHWIHATALMAAGRRAQAKDAYRRTIALDPSHEDAQVALRHLDPMSLPKEQRSVEDGWELPFEVDDLFAPPSAREIAQVRQMWAAQDLTPTGIEEVLVTEVKRDGTTYRVRVVSHLIDGSRHYGAIFVPQSARPGCCAVVVDVRGVAWDYPPRDISQGVTAMDILDPESGRFVFVVPGLRGEVLEIHGESYVSAGDRRNGWAGAVDDVVAFLDVALAETPEADADRVGLFGKSRGGSVALLAASRDRRVDCVVAWTGPADWFGRMGSYGWTLQELVERGLRQRWEPGMGFGSAGQFIEGRLQDPMEKGTPTLKETRLRLIASSPLYFVESLPAADLHYGVEDGSVSVANGHVLRERIEELDYPDGAARTVYLHEGAGHDVPWPEAYDASREFLLSHLDAR